MAISDFSEITVTADLSRPVMAVTWDDLCMIIGPKNPVLPTMRAQLDAGRPYNMDGVIVAATGKILSEHTLPRGNK